MSITLSETEWLSLISLAVDRIAADVNEAENSSLNLLLQADIARLNEYFAEWQQAKAAAAPSS